MTSGAWPGLLPRKPSRIPPGLASSSLPALRCENTDLHSQSDTRLAPPAQRHMREPGSRNHIASAIVFAKTGATQDLRFAEFVCADRLAPTMRHYEFGRETGSPTAIPSAKTPLDIEAGNEEIVPKEARRRIGRDAQQGTCSPCPSSARQRAVRLSSRPADGSLSRSSSMMRAIPGDGFIRDGVETLTQTGVFRALDQAHIRRREGGCDFRIDRSVGENEQRSPPKGLSLPRKQRPIGLIQRHASTGPRQAPLLPCLACAAPAPPSRAVGTDDRGRYSC